MNVKTLFVGFALLGACGKDIGAGGDGGDDDPMMPDAAPADGVPVDQVRFQRDVVPIFERSCGTMTNGCHDRAQYGANKDFDCRGWLTLENASLGAVFYSGPNKGAQTGCPDLSLHQRLTQLAPWQCAETSKYVKPAELSTSYLIDKVMGTDLCGVDGGSTLSQRMPPEDSMFVLTQQDRQTLEAWVMAGAKDD